MKPANRNSAFVTEIDFRLDSAVAKVATLQVFGIMLQGCLASDISSVIFPKAFIGPLNFKWYREPLVLKSWDYHLFLSPGGRPGQELRKVQGKGWHEALDSVKPVVINSKSSNPAEGRAAEADLSWWFNDTPYEPLGILGCQYPLLQDGQQLTNASSDTREGRFT
ncbi:hypothetical protein BTVI_47241 [Pitangus sulphuratus]|nr:hypothetical protein BTVI_47241 [Pitangus sulphuratus]